MILVRIMAGLGNQMFQYATARSLAWHWGVPLKLDLSWFADHPERQYGLDRFQIQAEVATSAEIQQARCWPISPLPGWRQWLGDSLRNRLENSFDNRFQCHTGHRSAPHTGQFWRERWFHFDPHLARVSPPVYLEGFWQSERYFASIATILQQEFALRQAPDDRNRQLAQQILQVPAVSLHVRRGDYAENPELRRLFGLCDLDYYRRAVHFLAQRVQQPSFFVFSDDPEWVKKHLNIPFSTTWVDHNTSAHPHLDLWLMRQCRHQIIANSSFSWWGAWLNTHPDKQVIAPRQWFQDYARFHKTHDLIPRLWHRL